MDQSLGHNDQHRAMFSTKGLLCPWGQRQTPSGALFASPFPILSYGSGPKLLPNMKNFFSEREHSSPALKQPMPTGFSFSTT